MKKGILFIVVALLLPLSFVACTDREKNPRPGEIVRLHVVANSDTQEDQDTKYRVRDAVLEKYGPDLDQLTDAQQAWDYVSGKLTEISALAENVLKENGGDYDAVAQMGLFDFPARSYAGQVVPAGEYPALKITLGQGEGQNWWCVMYPPLCMVSFGGDVDMEEYMQQVKEFAQLQEAGQDVQAPRSPVRSLLWDKVANSQKWDEFIASLMKKSK